MWLRKTLTVFTAGMVMLLVCWTSDQARTSAQTKPKSAPKAVPGKVTVFDCSIAWKDSRFISSRIPGIIDKVFVRDGQEIGAGEPLVKLDDRETQADYLIQSTLASFDSAILGSRARLSEFRTRLDDTSILFQRRAISEEEQRLAVVQVKIAEYEERQEVEKQALEKLRTNRLKVLLDDHLILSPVPRDDAGEPMESARWTVRRVFKKERESVTTGEDAILVELIRSDTVWVEGLVSVEHLYQVRDGQSVTMSLDFGKYYDSDGRQLTLPQEQREFNGTIVFVDPNIQDAVGAFKIRAEIANEDQVLRSGLPAKMTIQVK